jgi:hypothetical protein
MSSPRFVSDVVSVSYRFATSANVERDISRGVFDSYRLTSRGADVLTQIAAGMDDASAGRAFSITGPYGTGKSSFAVFLGALLADSETKLYQSAIEKLEADDSKLAARWRDSRNKIGMDLVGAAVGFVTAKAEPVSQTLQRAVAKFTTHEVSPSEVVAEIRREASARPVFLLLDEFGKNLEIFSSSQTSGDPFVLQELAESSQGAEPLPIFLITMQHLAFDEYVTDSSYSSRREWAKIQGRFQDVSFVETSLQSQVLVASALEVHEGQFAKFVDAWYQVSGEAFAQLTELKIARESYPLHPVALAALPELCNRYGQNERTLFSFVAGSESAAMPTLMTQLPIGGGSSVPFINLENLYDYFLASASSFIGVSSSASRWLEIETRIRDTIGLTPFEQKVLKSIAVLNLVSAGGALRASNSLILNLFQSLGFEPNRTTESLQSLVEKNLLTFREFSDEWRIWQGSDFDVRSAIELARTRVSRERTSDLLKSSLDFHSLVAGRTSQEKGILRIFSQCVATDGMNLDEIDPRDLQEFDGFVLLMTDAHPCTFVYSGSKPVIEIKPLDPETLRERALDVASVGGALEDLRNKKDDWVAQRELLERLTIAQQALRVEMQHQWDVRHSQLKWVNEPRGYKNPPARNFSEYLSNVSSEVYKSAPKVRNEMVAKRELSSQGAKARREIAESLLTKADVPALGFQGYGPEKSMYDAVFLATGIHAIDADHLWSLAEPTDTEWASIWDYLSATIVPGSRINLAVIGNGLKQPPFGLKSGLLWLIVFTYLVVNESDLSIYENDSLILALDDAIAERLLKNPSSFSARKTGVSSGLRKELVSKLGLRFGLRAGSNATFMTVVRALYRNLQQLPPYTLKTSAHLLKTATTIRSLFESAKEPDVLLFEAVPNSLGFMAIEDQKNDSEYEDRIDKLVEAIYTQFVELDKAYSDLLKRISVAIANSFGAPGEIDSLREHLTELSGRLPKTSSADFIATFKFAMERDFLDERSWLENLAMVILGGYPPRQWSDANEIEFGQSVVVAASKIRDLEKFAFASADQASSRRLVTLTSPDGTSTSELFDLDETKSGRANQLLTTISELPEFKGLNAREQAILLMSVATVKLESK